MAALGWPPGLAAGYQRPPLRSVRLDAVAGRRRGAGRPAGGARGGAGTAHPPRRAHLVRPRLPADTVAPCLRLDRRRHGPHASGTRCARGHTAGLGAALAVDRHHLRGPVQPDRRAGDRSAACRLERLGNVLGAVLCRRHLGKRRLPARAGLPFAVPVRTHAAAADRSTYAAHAVRRPPRRATRTSPIRPGRRAGPWPRPARPDHCTGLRVPRRASAAGRTDADLQRRPSWRLHRLRGLHQRLPDAAGHPPGAAGRLPACGACLEACAQQQHRAGFGPGLVRYCSPQAMAGQPKRWWRPRTLALLSCCWRCLPAAPGACSESTRPVGVRWYQLRASDNAQLLDDQRHFVGELGTLGPCGTSRSSTCW